MTVTFQGFNCHPGWAKGKMVNAVKVAADFIHRLPKETDAPENTEDFEGYVHPNSMEASVDRTSVHFLIRDLSQTVHSARPGLLFGVSPFGIHSKDTAPSNIKVGVDQYHELFSDPVVWLRQGWVDYLSPQLYWKDSGPQSFSTLLSWWRNPKVNPRGVAIIPGIAVDRLESQGWPVSEIDRQLSLEKSISPRPRGGFLLWNIAPVSKNTKGVMATIRAR
jgi:hypothetical protein